MSTPRDETSPAEQRDLTDLLPLAQLRDDFTRFMLSYRFGIDELMTKITILRDEMLHTQRHNPIEHLNSRLKSPESIVRKAQRRGIPLDLEAIRTEMTDIAGVRITCKFISDTYRVSEMLTRQSDVTVLDVKDYIAEPKANGYKSLHLIVEIPVYMSDRVVPVKVEVQIRTIAMDFWASLEHTIYYKYGREVPAALLEELRQAAEAASELDVKMETLRDEVTRLGDAAADDTADAAFDDTLQTLLPAQLLRRFLDSRPGGAK